MAMTKRECMLKLKQQLELGRRLKEAGLFTAAVESRNRAQVLLQAYKRHFRNSRKAGRRSSRPLESTR
jgi:hypothetical protein